MSCFTKITVEYAVHWGRFLVALPFLIVGAIGMAFLAIGSLIWGEEV